MSFPLCQNKKPRPLIETTIKPKTVILNSDDVQPRGGSSGIPEYDLGYVGTPEREPRRNESGNESDETRIAMAGITNLWNNKWAALIGGLLLGIIVGIPIGILINKQWGKGTEQKYRSKSASESVSQPLFLEYSGIFLIFQ